MDLDRAVVVKDCAHNEISDVSVIQQWISNIPSKGPLLEWYFSDPMDRLSLLGMTLDPTVPCEASFSAVSPSDITSAVADGTSGVADLGASNGIIGGFDARGRVMALLQGSLVYFPVETLPSVLLRDRRPDWIIINNGHALVVGMQGGRDGIRSRAMVFRKSDRTWHVLTPPGGAITNLRGFGKYIAIAESRAKTAITEQATRGAVVINERVRKQESSAGRATWRKGDGRRGPGTEEAFESSTVVYPGRLHIYNVETEQMTSLRTDQGDSEILLIDQDTAYYRIVDRLYKAQLTDRGCSSVQLLATGEEIRDAHWAFHKP